MDYKVYNSAEKTDYLQINAPYYNAINQTTILFEIENISVTIDSLGHIEFFDINGNSIVFTDLPVHKDPSQYGHTAQYGEVRCSSDGEVITIFLPVYWWSDSYPHCDGESDRWSRHIDHWFRVVFNCGSKQIFIPDA